MKRCLILVAWVAAGLTLLSGICDSEIVYQAKGQAELLDYPPIENLDFEVIEDLDGHTGGGLRVFWDPPADTTPDEYAVEVDGITETIVDTEYYAYDPAGEIAVYAVYGESWSDPIELGLKAVETEYLEAWSAADPSPDHPSGIGFAEDGHAEAYAMSWPENWPYIDYYVDTIMNLSSPNLREPEPMNYENNCSCEETGSYEDLELVVPCELESYVVRQLITQHQLYGLWLDPEDDGYTADDHFGKAYIVGVYDLMVTFRLAYQTVPGLRWVVTDRGFTGIEE